MDGKALSRGALCHRPASVPPRQGGCRVGVRLLSPAPPALFCPRMGDTLPSTPTSPVGVLWGGSWTGHLGLHTRGAAVLEGWREGPSQCPSAPAGPQPSSPGLGSAPQVGLLTALGAQRGLSHPGHRTPQGRPPSPGWLTGEAAGSEAEGEERPYCPRRLPGDAGQHVSTRVCALQSTVFTVLCPLR